MSVLRPEILVIGLDPAGLECALGAASARVGVVVVTQGPVAGRPSGGLDPLNRIRALGGQVIEGEGRFRDSRHFFVNGMTLAARRTVLALPAGVAPPPAIPGLAAVPRWSPGVAAQAVMVLSRGLKGPALAHAVRQEGHRAILVAPEGLLPDFDSEAVDALADHLRRSGVVLHNGMSLEGARVEVIPEGFLLHPPEGAPIGFSHIHVDAIAPPVLEGLALEVAGVVVEAGRPRCADGLRTTNPHVLALGATRSPLADPATARAEAGIALSHVLFRRAPQAALAQLPRLVQGPLTLLEAGMTQATMAQRPRATTRYYRVPLQGGGFLKAATDPRGRVLRVCVLARHAPGLAGPLLQILADQRPLAMLASLPLPALEEADAMAALGRLALAERLSGVGARMVMRLARLLG